MGLLRICRDLYHRWYRDDTGLLAAAVAYYAAMSLFPLLLVLTSGLGAFLKWTNTGKDARQSILDAVSEQLSPALSQNIEQALAHVQNYAGFGGPVGAITLLLTALAIFAQFERAFDRIWSVPVQNASSIWSGFGQLLKYRLRAFAMLVGLGVAVVLVFASGWAFTAFQSRMAARFQTSAWVWRSLDMLLQVALNALVFSALIPSAPQTTSHLATSVVGRIVHGHHLGNRPAIAGSVYYWTTLHQRLRSDWHVVGHHDLGILRNRRGAVRRAAREPVGGAWLAERRRERSGWRGPVCWRCGARESATASRRSSAVHRCSPRGSFGGDGCSRHKSCRGREWSSRGRHDGARPRASSDTETAEQPGRGGATSNAPCGLAARNRLCRDLALFRCIPGHSAVGAA